MKRVAFRIEACASRPAITVIRRRALQAVRFDVPAHPAEHFVARGGKCGGVRDRRTRDESNTRRRRKPEQLQQPACRDVLDRRGRRRQNVKAGVLVPRRSQPLGRHGSRHTAASDETKVSWTGCRHEARIGGRCKALDHRLRVLRLFGQRPAERNDEFTECRGGKDWTTVDALEKIRGELARPGKKRIRHAEKVSPPLRTNVGPAARPGLLIAAGSSRLTSCRSP